MKTLEQVIQDEIEAWQSWRDKLAVEQKTYMLPRSEATAIAATVREWMREQNEGLRKDIYRIIAAIDWEATSTSIVTDKILSAIPPRTVSTGTSPAEADDDIHNRLVNTEPLYAWANKRIEMLEAENKRIKEQLEDATCSVSPNDLAAVQKQLEQERVQVDWLKGEIVLQVRLKDERKLAEKAKQYDALREKFPFLPGEEFWTLYQNSVTKWTIEKVWFNNDGRLCLTGYRKRQNGSILESPTYKASECYPTADACRNAIKVEE